LCHLFVRPAELDYRVKVVFLLPQNRLHKQMDTQSIIQKIGDVVVRETPLKDGMPHGIEKEYTPAGVLLCERSWVNGKQDGDEIFRKADGSVALKMLYQNGVLIKQN
jgi:antitoxin component YwqK of YwqJK toxin-antitoxin module